MARCQRIKGDGTRCKLPAIGSNGLCYSHDPAKQQQRRRTAQRAGKAGGRGRASVELKRLQGRFEELAEQVLSDDLDPRVGAVTCQLLTGARACVRDGLMAQDVEEVRGRMEALEEALQARRTGRGALGV